MISDIHGTITDIAMRPEISCIGTKSIFYAVIKTVNRIFDYPIVIKLTKLLILNVFNLIMAFTGDITLN